MAYNTLEAWVAMFPRIHTSGRPSDELRLELETAHDFINAYLTRRYAVPFGTPPPIVKRLELWGATAMLFDRAQDTPPWVTGLWDKFIATLKALAEGEIGLPGIAEREDTGGVESSTSTYTPTFGIAPSRAEIVDPDRAESEADDRDS